MSYLTRKDIPYHYALADAFTVCDAYYCSLMGPTDPNRYHMWTGWVGNDGKNGGPVITNAEAGYDLSTYPERLQTAGISLEEDHDERVRLEQDGPVHQLRRERWLLRPHGFSDAAPIARAGVVDRPDDQ